MTIPLAVQGLYACLAVSDIDAATQWYATLFGRAPDDRPFPEMVQWRGWGNAGVQLWHDPAQAGTSRITMVLPDMAAARAELEPAGIVPEPDNKGAWGIVAQLTDPDGNRITLAEPPKGFVG